MLDAQPAFPQFHPPSGIYFVSPDEQDIRFLETGDPSLTNIHVVATLPEVRLAQLLAAATHLTPRGETGPRSNQRLKLSARGGRVIGNRSFLSAAAAGRSLSAIR